MPADALPSITSPVVPLAGTQAFARYRNVARLSGLDGLRYFCILAVLWHHAPVHTAMGDPARILDLGFLGVDLFFVLSGFLITTLLLREEARDRHFFLRGFYRRRLLRIMLVYFLVMTVAAAFSILLRGETQIAALLPYYHLFFSIFLTTHIPMLGPTWSLAVEEQHYLLWPILLLILPRRAVLPFLRC